MPRGIYRHAPSPFIGGRQPLEPGKLPPSITAVPEDNPPFGLPNPLWVILPLWQPYQGPLPQESRHVPVEVSAVPENDPPFGLLVWLWPVLAAWQPGPPAPWRPTYAPPEIPAQVDNPPFGIPNPIWQILQSWIPDPPQPPVGAHVPVDVSAVPENDPPFGLPPIWLRNVIEQWQVPRQFQLKGPQFISPTPAAGGWGLLLDRSRNRLILGM